VFEVLVSINHAISKGRIVTDIFSQVN